ncbi:MAG: efflux RND transporter periplasmic adaptor subunit, partial [Xanthomonadaceae bacterium]|nr:efflux RND transporter periplasmic adaptor subunit [Xanthomonadaceae bacterium]
MKIRHSSTLSTASGHLTAVVGYIAAGIVLLLAILSTGCGKTAQPTATDQVTVEQDQLRFPADSPQLRILHSVPIEAATQTAVTLPARLSWSDEHTSTIRSPVSGQIVGIQVTPGQTVKAGQVLAWITSPEFGEMQAEYARSTAELRQAQRTLQRSRELHDAGVVSDRELEEVEATDAAIRADHARIVERARQYGGGTQINQKMPLRAPIDGVIVERYLNPGQSVGPEWDAERPLLTISDPDKLWLQVDVPEALADRIRVGQSVAFSLSDGRRVETRLNYVADYVDTQTRTVAARADIDNIARRLKAGQYVRANIALPVSGIDAPA